MTDTTSDWQPIATAPRDKTLKLRGRVFFSAEHARNTGISDLIVHGEGRWLYGGFWTGILGGQPGEWMEIENDTL